jgi:hypothetical protein
MDRGSFGRAVQLAGAGGNGYQCHNVYESSACGASHFRANSGAPAGGTRERDVVDEWSDSCVDETMGSGLKPAPDFVVDRGRSRYTRGSGNGLGPDGFRLGGESRSDGKHL